MSNIISVKKIWDNSGFVPFCNRDTTINCGTFNLGAIRQAWVKRVGSCCGGEDAFSLVFENPNDSNALSGFWVEAGDRGILIDAASADDITAACNACCGESTVVAPVNEEGYPAVTDAALSTFCITRSDNGSIIAINKMYLDYLNEYATMVHKSSTAGVSKYQVTAYTQPVPKGTDVVAAGACA